MRTFLHISRHAGSTKIITDIRDIHNQMSNLHLGMFLILSIFNPLVPIFKENY